ncbi:MAG: hypothetical protein U9Q21_03540, partial [Candidatus Auribacterota bacterium]|nr:hypothetical protein [Candidatus Auribacterota bacterium]
LYLIDTELLYKGLNDLSEYYYKKSQLAECLASLLRQYEELQRQMSRLEKMVRVVKEIKSIENNKHLTQQIADATREAGQGTLDGISYSGEGNQGSDLAPEDASVSESKPTVSRLIISPQSVELELGQGTHLSAKAIDSEGNSCSIDLLKQANFVWSINNPQVARLNSEKNLAGLVALEKGSAQVLCQVGGVFAAANVTVIEKIVKVPALSDLVITPAAATIKGDDVVSFSVQALDLDGNPLGSEWNSFFSFDWIVNDASVANISGQGPTATLVPIKGGVVQAICRAGGAMGVATVTVLGELDEIDFSGEADVDEIDRIIKEYDESQKKPSGFGQVTSGVTTKRYIKPVTEADRARGRAQAAEFDAMMRAEQERQQRVWAEGQEDINRAIQQMGDTMNLMGQSYSGQKKQTSQQKEHRIQNPYKKYESYTGEKWKYGEGERKSPSGNRDDGWFSKANVNYSPGNPNGTPDGTGKKVCPNGELIKVSEVCSKFIPYHD